MGCVGGLRGHSSIYFASSPALPLPLPPALRAPQEAFSNTGVACYCPPDLDVGSIVFGSNTNFLTCLATSCPSPPSPILPPPAASPAVAAGVTGDPKLWGADGDEADFRGEHRGCYNILSARNLSLNTLIEHASFITPHSKINVHGSWVRMSWPHDSRHVHEHMAHMPHPSISTAASLTRGQHMESCMCACTEHMSLCACACVHLPVCMCVRSCKRL